MSARADVSHHHAHNIMQLILYIYIYIYYVYILQVSIDVMINKNVKRNRLSLFYTTFTPAHVIAPSIKAVAFGTVFGELKSSKCNVSFLYYFKNMLYFFL